MGDFGIAGLWLLLALSLVAAVLIAAFSMWLAERTLSKPVSKRHNKTLSPFMTCVGLVYGALLGFTTIVVAWEQFSSAETNVSNEASTLITMYRQTVGMPVPEQTQMRVLLRKYTDAVAGPEWENAIRAGSGTESARDALNEMYGVLGSEQSSVASSPISQKFLDQLGTLASERNQRILDAKPRIPDGTPSIGPTHMGVSCWC
jgi:branched-subunit amino acid ABC-type transport system permease component